VFGSVRLAGIKLLSNNVQDAAQDVKSACINMICVRTAIKDLFGRILNALKVAEKKCFMMKVSDAIYVMRVVKHAMGRHQTNVHRVARE